MYVPTSFAENDLETLQELMRRDAFATLVSTQDGVPVASHIPFALDARRGAYGTLLGHVARANPQWRSFGGGEALVIFQGPHAYVSPTWYAGGDNVPTWNYAVVHAYGLPRLIEDPAAARAVIELLVAAYEGGRRRPWTTATPPASFVERLLGAIVVFEIPIERLQGKFKLSQNKTEADRAGVIAGLRAEGDAATRALAELMAAR